MFLNLTFKPIIQILSFYFIFSLICGPVLAQQYTNPTIKTNVPNLNEEPLNSQNLPKDKNRVPLSEKSQVIRVHVLGEVQNPGIFAISISDRLSDVLDMAGLKRVSQRMIQVRRLGEKTRFYDLYRYHFQGDVSQNIFLQDNDVIFVPEHKGIVRIEGPTSRPGLYELNGEKHLDQIIKLAGGLSASSSKVYPIKVVRFSKSGKKSVLDVENIDKKLHSFGIETGDIIIVPDIINRPKKFDYSVETIPGENIVYPTSIPDVFVMGNVINPGPYAYKSNYTVKEYVAFSGPSVTSRLNAVTVIRNGARKKVKFTGMVNPGDIIVVRSKINFNAIVGTISTGLTLLLTTLLIQERI